ISAWIAGATITRAAETVDWSGLYFGGHVGFSRGKASVTLADPATQNFRQPFGALYGGVQAGANYLLSPRWLVGGEADITFPNYLGADDVVWSRTTAASDIAEQIDYAGTLRGRLG